MAIRVTFGYSGYMVQSIASTAGVRLNSCRLLQECWVRSRVLCPGQKPDPSEFSPPRPGFGFSSSAAAGRGGSSSYSKLAAEALGAECRSPIVVGLISAMRSLSSNSYSANSMGTARADLRWLCLPFSDVLNWKAFSVQVQVRDIPNIKKILMGISQSQYLRMQRRVKQVQRHFAANGPPRRYDVFHMTVHSIWLRRLNIRIADST